MALIRDLSTWYDTPAEFPAEAAFKQAFQDYRVAWPAGFVVLIDKPLLLTYTVIKEWVDAHKTGRATVHSHPSIAIVFFEVYEDALAFYMTYAK